jgi:hypothetical protein
VKRFLHYLVGPTRVIIRKDRESFDSYTEDTEEKEVT